MVQPTISIHQTATGKWRCIVPRGSTPFLIPYLRRRGLVFTATPDGSRDNFEFADELTVEELKAVVRGFGARVLRPGEAED